MSRTKAIAAFLSVTMSLLSGCGDSGSDRTLDKENLPAPEQARYDTVQAQRGNYAKEASGALQIYYPVTAELCWEEGNAMLREILVRGGQEVKAGECLATFDIDVSKADREELQLSLTRKNEELEDGKTERMSAIEEARSKLALLGGHEYNIELLKIGKLETEYEQFVYQTEREISRLRERLEEMEEEMANDALLAPFDGVIDVVTSKYNAGDPVEADVVIVSMHATDQYYLAAEDTGGKLRYNVEVIVEAGKRNDRKTYTGRVVAAPDILPSSVPQGMALIQLDEDIPPEELKGTLQYRFNAEELQNVLLADWGAVDNANGKNYVYVLEDDMVQKRYIVPGLNNREKAWVLDGLYEGQTLIAD